MSERTVRSALAALALGAVLVVLLGVPVVRAADPASSLLPGLEARYAADAQLDYGRGRLVVDSAATVSNGTGAALDVLHFNIAPAAIGTFELAAVTVDDVPATAALTNQSLTVTLPASLEPEAAATVRIGYTAHFATTSRGWLFGKLNGTVQAYRWIPWLSRVTPFERNNAGDPFVTAVSPEVRVRLTTDRPLVIASSGRQLAVDGLSREYVAHNVRDFNFVAAPARRVLRGRVAGVAIVVHNDRLNGEAMLNVAKRSVRRLTELVGPYPYPALHVAESGGGYAMESPALVWIPRATRASDIEWLVAHEVAHQWFYAVVGNDQPAEPFADEALVTLLTRVITGDRRSSTCAQRPLDRSIYEYGACYYGIIYVQGADYLASYRRRVGEEAFWRGVRDYYAANTFGLAGTRELLDTLDAAAAPGTGGGHATRFPRIYVD